MPRRMPCPLDATPMPRNHPQLARASAPAQIALCVLGFVVLLVSAGPASAENDRSDRLARIAATVAGRPVDVSCETRAGRWSRDLVASHLAPQAVAYYDPNTQRIRFGPVICGDSSRYRRGASLRSVRVLFIAAHEAAHAAGIEDEAVANCWALSWVQDLARAFLGVELSPASRLVRSYARQLQRDSPPAYRSACSG